MLSKHGWYGWLAVKWGAALLVVGVGVFLAWRLVDNLYLAMTLLLVPADILFTSLATGPMSYRSYLREQAAAGDSAAV
jgi:hypothetical protein